MKYYLTAIILLLLYTTHFLTSPIVNLEKRDEDCYMEWITVYGDTPTGSSASPTDSNAGLTGAGKRIMRHSRRTISTAAVVADASASSSLVVEAMHTIAAVEAAKQYIAPSKAASSSDAAPLASSSPSAPSYSAAAASGSGASSAPSAGSSTSLTPGGKKAGISGFGGVTTQSGWSQFSGKISWYFDYTPDPADSGSIKGIGMLWGDGKQGSQDASRLSTFLDKVATETSAPEYMMGFYEPDWTPPDSSAIKPRNAAALWTQYLFPLGKRGTKLGSPSLAKQMDEDWLSPFQDAPQKPVWDFTCIHANKNSSALVQADVEYYYHKYQKPVWVSEFSCMNDLEWTLCEDPTTFTKETVAYLEGSEMVVAYGYSDGDGLPESWKIFDGNGGLSANGETYLAVLGG